MSLKRGQKLEGLRALLVYFVGMCFVQYRKVDVRAPRSKVLQAGS